jgi:hypothetical protein
MRGGDIYAHMCASLCSPNGHPAIQAKYTYSTLLPAFLFGCVVYASATTYHMGLTKVNTFLTKTDHQEVFFLFPIHFYIISDNKGPKESASP